MRILLVEDDASLGRTIQSWLQLDGYAVDWLDHGDLADAALRTHDYQCLVLDRGLPGASGDAILAALRARSEPLPVLLITARDALADRIEGLDLGADDYLVKPFDLEELSARIRAALRRGAATVAPVLLRHGAVALDPAAKRVTLDGVPVPLTAREFTVLQTLMRRSGQVFSRAQLEEALYGWGEEVESNAIEVHISNLRKKLGARFITTVRNHGYGLAPA
ncbi:response regulator transcription factor [Xylophilus sp.]|uniref:response regulator transcription factor n=1 Tax=Xylophilus sp. TaxID=2653893 RepID=UPI0013B74000|nr:response regulator transcription factor [Xylophilus sp.]KAF1050197.1 MAG: Transcriptional regulatory protein QseB [Xylophilus sp.]